MAYDDLPLRFIHNHTHLKNQMMQLFFVDVELRHQWFRLR